MSHPVDRRAGGWMSPAAPVAPAAAAAPAPPAAAAAPAGQPLLHSAAAAHRLGYVAVLLDAVVLLLALLALRRLLGALAGPPEVPYWDEYDFFHMARHLHQTGVFVRTPETSSLAVTPTYWGVLFTRLGGLSLETLRLSVQVLAFGGALALDVWLLLRGLSRWPRFLLVGATFAGPLTLGLLNAYMSDVMFLSLQAVALPLLLAGVTGVAGGRWQWLVLGSGVAVLAFGAREVAAALLPAVIAGLWLARARPAAYLAAGAPLLVVLLLYFVTGRQALAGGGAEHIWGALRGAGADPLSPTRGLPKLGAQVGYLSLLMLEAAALTLLPVAVLVARGLPAALGSGAPGVRVVRWGLALAALLLATVGLLRLLGGGAPWWPLGEAVGVPLLPKDMGGVAGSRLGVWIAVVLLADLSLLALLGGVGVALIRPQTRIRAAVPAAAAAAALPVMALVDTVIVRYAVAILVPLTVAAAAGLDRRLLGRGTLALATGCLVALAVAALAAYRAYRVTTAALWDGAAGLTAAGVPPREIYAGYEYAGVHGVLSDRAQAMQPGESWNTVVMRFDAPYVVAVEQLPPGYRRLETWSVEILPGVRRQMVIGRDGD